MLDYCLSKAAKIPVETHRQRVYSCVTDKRGRVIGEGSNSYTRTHPEQFRFACLSGNEHKPFIHAEMCAIIRALKNGKPHAIWIARVHKNGNGALAAPCPSCQLAIKEAGIKEIHYTY